MKEIIERIDTIYLLKPLNKQALLDKMQRVEVVKGNTLIDAGKVERYAYFIAKGILRAYISNANGQTTIWFGEEGDMALSFLSFFDNEPGYEYVEALEDCVLYKIAASDLQQLYTNDVSLANWGRKFAEQELVRTEKRFMSSITHNASERYAALLLEKPSIIQRVALKHIASYLGITQVSLSRIRASI